MKVDTFGGTVHVEWDPDAAATPLGHLAFFAEYLKVSGRFDALVADCPLHYASPNAPSKRDVLGTVMLSILAGQWRYAHITALCGDGVNPGLLGMSKVASEDSVRRGLERIEAEVGALWLQGHTACSRHEGNLVRRTIAALTRPDLWRAESSVVDFGRNRLELSPGNYGCIRDELCDNHETEIEALAGGYSYRQALGVRYVSSSGLLAPFALQEIEDFIG